MRRRSLHPQRVWNVLGTDGVIASITIVDSPRLGRVLRTR
jgi:hypothetical protein